MKDEKKMKGESGNARKGELVICYLQDVQRLIGCLILVVGAVK